MLVMTAIILKIKLINNLSKSSNRNYKTKKKKIQKNNRNLKASKVRMESQSFRPQRLMMINLILSLIKVSMKVQDLKNQAIQISPSK